MEVRRWVGGFAGIQGQDVSGVAGYIRLEGKVEHQSESLEFMFFPGHHATSFSFGPVECLF